MPGYFLFEKCEIQNQLLLLCVRAKINVENINCHMIFRYQIRLGKIVINYSQPNKDIFSIKRI
jgi:hypothetical protein